MALAMGGGLLRYDSMLQKTSGPLLLNNPLALLVMKDFVQDGRQIILFGTASGAAKPSRSLPALLFYLPAKVYAAVG